MLEFWGGGKGIKTDTQTPTHNQFSQICHSLSSQWHLVRGFWKPATGFEGKHLCFSHLTSLEATTKGVAISSNRSQNYRLGSRLSNENFSEAQRGSVACPSSHSKPMAKLAVETNVPNSCAAFQRRQHVTKSENCTMSLWEYSTGCTIAYIIQGITIVFLLSLLSGIWQVVGTEKGVALIHYDYSHRLHEHAMCSAICSHVDYLCYQESAYPPSPEIGATNSSWGAGNIFFSPFDSSWHYSWYKRDSWNAFSSQIQCMWKGSKER